MAVLSPYVLDFSMQAQEGADAAPLPFTSLLVLEVVSEIYQVNIARVSGGGCKSTGCISICFSEGNRERKSLRKKELVSRHQTTV